MHFHDLCYTFATIALGNVIDGKPLSTILGHVSAATTLDIYPHITNLMRSEAAKKIEQRIGKAASQESLAEPQEKRMMTTFQPYVGGKRMFPTVKDTTPQTHAYITSRTLNFGGTSHETTDFL